jgi:hypothetical protein
VLAVLGHAAGNVAIVVLHVSTCDKNIVNFMQVEKSANMLKMRKKTCQRKIEQRVKGTLNTKIAGAKKR